MKRHTAFLMMAILPSCLLARLAAGQAATREKVGNLSFAIPSKWTCTPSKTGPGVSIMSPTTHKLGIHDEKDVLIARAMPANGHSLEELRDGLVKVTAAQAKKSFDDIKQRTGTPLTIDIRNDFTIKSRKTAIGSVTAYELTSQSILIVDGNPVKMHGRIIISYAAGTYYLVSAVYAVDRDKVMKPISDAFLASLRFDSSK